VTKKRKIANDIERNRVFEAAVLQRSRVYLRGNVYPPIVSTRSARRICTGLIKTEFTAAIDIQRFP
jgi:hypothetical protein